jgi:hypothetical protein
VVEEVKHLKETAIEIFDRAKFKQSCKKAAGIAHEEGLP